MRGWFGQSKRREHPLGAPGPLGRNGFGVPFHLAFTFHPLPDTGAMGYSYDTLLLPKYTPIGNGPGNKYDWRYHQAVFSTLQGVTLQAIGSPGVFTGQLQAQPLVDTTETGLPPDLAIQMALKNPQQFALPEK